MSRLFFAVMYCTADDCGNAISGLTALFGRIIAVSDEYDFDFTDYYEKEMGNGLKKRFIVFDYEAGQSALAEAKRKAACIEKKLSDNGKRRVNIDPGYVSKDGVVLASWKKRSFKDNLSDGIFSHRVLSFEGGRCRDFWHTFADYRLEKTKEFFLGIRSAIIRQP